MAEPVKSSVHGDNFCFPVSQERAESSGMVADVDWYE
jgi:hypothetical protein